MVVWQQQIYTPTDDVVVPVTQSARAAVYNAAYKAPYRLGYIYVYIHRNIHIDMHMYLCICVFISLDSLLVSPRL